MCRRLLVLSSSEANESNRVLFVRNIKNAERLPSSPKANESNGVLARNTKSAERLLSSPNANESNEVLARNTGMQTSSSLLVFVS